MFIFFLLCEHKKGEALSFLLLKGVRHFYIERLGEIFLSTKKKASCNYGIGVDGRVGMYVEEKNRSWCSSSSANDQRAVTIECASDATEPYAFNDAVYNKLIELCIDICKRNGKNKLIWLGDKDKTLKYSPKSEEMILTVHRWFAKKSCPGNWMYSRMGDLAERVTVVLGGSTLETEEEESTLNVPFKVKISIPNLNIRKGPGTNYPRTGKFTGIGLFTITETSAGQGSKKGWGKLKSGVGWISLDYCSLA